MDKLTLRRVFVLALVAGIGATLGSAAVHGFFDFMSGLLGLDYLAAWLIERENN